VVVLASPRGLSSATFLVRGRVPACVSSIGAVRYWR
jgi:hypothetical protein